MTYHQTIIMGNLGRDPELREVRDNTVCNFAVAVSEKWSSNGEQQERTTWYNVSVWGAQAKACHRYLRKGSQALVTGNVSVRAYTKQDGTPGASLDLRAQRVQFVGGGASDSGTSGRSASDDDMNNIPF